MTLTLLALASIAAANPLRAAAASPAEDRERVAGAAVALVVSALFIAAALSGPFFDAIDLHGPSARIAAGVALVAVCLKDLFAGAPSAEPALTGWRAGLIPVGFPVILNPALVLLAMAGAVDRGVIVTLGAMVPAIVLDALAVVAAPRKGVRSALSAVAVAGAAVGALVVLDGVYSI